MNERKRFKQLFQSGTMVEVDKACQEFGFSSKQQLTEAMDDWKLGDFYDITGTFVVRNDTPTRWGSLKKILKKAGKWGLTKCVPVAIGIATGGLGLGAVAAPAVSEIVNKLRNRGLDVSEEGQAELENVLLNKTDASIDTLMEKLRRSNQGKGMAQEKLERLIRLSIKEDLHPFLAEIQSVLSSLQQEQAHLSEIFEDWMVEQRARLDSLETTIKDEFNFTNDGLDRIEQALDPLLEGLEEIKVDLKENKVRLISMEEKLDSLFQELCKESLEALTFDDLKQASRIQFQNVRLAGKFDKPYDKDLFIETQQLENDFISFLKDKQDTHPLFLMLASVGMGKTWNAVHLGIEAREMGLAIPLFIPIHMGYNSILRQFFQIERVDLSALGRIVGEKCEKILSNTGKRVLLILDGLDEYPDPNREPFLNFLRHSLQGYKHAVRVLLTDRTTDWCENKQLRGFYRDVSHLIWSNTELKGICNLYKIGTPLSGFLEGFTDSQLDRAIVQYGLDKEKFPPKLYELCHRPYILRIAYERDQYFDPDNVEQFRSVFFDRLNPVNTILDRMGIANPRELLFPLFEQFGIASAVKSERDIQALIDRNRVEWDLILRSGLLRIEQKGYHDVYKLDSVFHPIINDYLIQVGVLSESEISPSVQESSAKTPNINANFKEDNVQILETRKKCEYLMGLGKQNLESKKFDDALANLQKARATCDEELFDLDLLNEIDGLIRNVGRQKDKEKEEEKKIAAQENDKIVDEAKALFDENRWEDAIEVFKRSKEICQQQGWAEGVNYADVMIVKSEENLNREQAENKEEEGNQNIVSFRGAEIPQVEAEVLQELEAQAGKQFTLKISVGQNIKMGFSVENGNITGLGLCDCGLKTLPERIEKLSSMKELWLQGNQLIILPDSIGKLNSLTKLDLNSNKLSSLPESIGNLMSLKFLFINDNMLSNLPETICNLTSLETLYLRNNQLNALPECIGNMMSLKDLYLSDNHLSNLPESIGNLSYLRTLYLGKNLLTRLPESIGKLKSLTSLNLSYNKISTLTESIGNLSHLNELLLGRNELLNLPETLSNLKSLNILYLDGNKLSTLPKSIEQLSSLQVLNMNANQLKKLPESIGTLKKLELLRLNDNKLSTIPESIRNFSSLKELHLENNQFSIFPEIISDLSNLNQLYFNRNQLSNIPASIGQLSSLKALQLSGNQLSALPDSISNFESLETLNLARNKFTTFPDSINKINTLKKLFIDENLISTLPKSIGNLTSLETLALTRNQFSNLPETIGKLISLKTFFLYGNKLEFLPKSIANLKSLKSLYLSKNNFSTFPESILNLESLFFLSLHSNQLSTIPESLGRLKSLKYLDLEYNQLSRLPESIINLKSLERIKLGNNEFKKLQNSIKILKDRRVKITGIEGLEYEQPEETSNKLVSFKGAQIPQVEADVLQEIEAKIGKQFTLVNKVEWNTQMGFSVGNNRVTGIGLYQCGVSTLPESITNLRSLETLYLGDNQLTTLPESIGQLSSLQDLRMHNNQLTTLPESIGHLSSLKVLYLNINQLSTLPGSIGNLSSLQTVVLRDNKLTTLPESIGQLSSLQTLYLYNNQLSTLPESMINISSLKNVYISGNQLDSRAKSVLKQLKKKGVSVST